MIFTAFEIYKYSIPMHPFTIATGTMNFAQNIFIKAYTSENIVGVGECSAFPMIVGETQETCFVMAKDFAQLWKNKDALDIQARMSELHAFTAYNATIKSAFDMVLYDIAAKHAGKPLYSLLNPNAKQKEMITDLTIGIDTPENMAAKAKEFIERGVQIIKIKLGKHPAEDVERVKQIREAVHPSTTLRVDANQGWSYADAEFALNEISRFDIEFCEQPMRRHHDPVLPELVLNSPVKLMADESVFDHHDAKRLIATKACDYVNIKFAKSSGILEAIKINEVCRQSNIPCMMGGMLESRLALTAFAHFAKATDNIRFYDMDTCMLGHKLDPVKGGVSFNNFSVTVPEEPGVGAEVDGEFLKSLESAII
ncbi:dipeptide epimerase [Chitinophagaceae bacterium 26-R-25]|nr:dipeptide epimerase [Chitinophagaceae bacterium 26-R-25]